MIEIKTPVFPESIADGEVAAWHVEVGDTVKRDQVLVDIETDKVVLEVVAPDNGILKKIFKEVGETVLTEETLGEFEPGVLDNTTPSTKENKIKVDEVEGTGKGGRITKEDILRSVAAIAHTDELADRLKPATRVAEAPESNLVPQERLERRVPMTRLRASIAQRLVEAQHNAAMLTTFNEVDMQPI